MVKPGGVTEEEGVGGRREGDGDDLSGRADGGDYESVMMRIHGTKD